MGLSQGGAGALLNRSLYLAAPPGPAALSFPGTDETDASGDHVNVLATLAVTDPVALKVTLDSPLPTGWYLDLIDSNDLDGYQTFLQIPPDIAAGDYAFGLGAGTWRIIASDFVAYDGSLVGSGSWLTKVPSSPSALTFPGSDEEGAFGAGLHSNLIGTFTATEQGALVLSLDTAFNVLDNWQIALWDGSGTPDVQNLHDFTSRGWHVPAAGSYSILLYQGGTYHPAVSNSGTFEFVPISAIG